MMDPREDDWTMSPTSRYRISSGCVRASDPDYVVVQSSHDARRLSEDILGDRDGPIIGLTRSLDGPEPVLEAREVRTVVGAGVRIYLVADEDLLHELRETIGPRLKLERGSARIWWPGATARCDPSDHPLVVALDGESAEDTLEELACQFDLSRPRVRSQIRLVEDARAFLEHELECSEQRNRKCQEQLRDAKIEAHGLRARAEAAEARLTAALRQSESG